MIDTTTPLAQLPCSTGGAFQFHKTPDPRMRTIRSLCERLDTARPALERKVRPSQLKLASIELTRVDPKLIGIPGKQRCPSA